MKISKSDLGWVAGIIDLKVMIVRKNNKRRKTPQIVLLVDCKEDRVVRRLARLTGTAPEAHSQHPLKPFMRRGCKEHCKEPHIHVDEEYPWNHARDHPVDAHRSCCRDSPLQSVPVYVNILGVPWNRGHDLRDDGN